MVSPAPDCDSSRPFVCVRYVEDGEGWKFRINRNGDVFAQVATPAGQRQPLARAECVRDSLPSASPEGKVPPSAHANTNNGFRCGKRSQNSWSWPQQRDNTTVEMAVEFDPQD